MPALSRRLITACAGLLLLAIVSPAAAAPATAVELNWKWKRGDVHRYRARSNQNVAMDAMGMKIRVKMKIDATFALRVRSVARDGSANADVVVEGFKVTDDKGGTVASVANLPKGAVKTPVRIDKKGNFTFREIVYLLVEDGGASMLVSGSAGPNGSTASATAGGNKVTVWAKFDRKTGRLSGGYSVKNVGRKKSRVAVRSNARRIDVVPKQFLEMLRLPVGPMKKGDDLTTRVADWRIRTKVMQAHAKKGARFEVIIDTPGTGTGLSKPGASVKGKAGGVAVHGAMPAMKGIPGVGGMGGMGGMGAMPGMPGAPGAKAGKSGGMQLPTLRMEGAFEAGFDVRKGWLRKIQGGMKTEQTVPGMGSGSIVTDTTLDMKRL